MRKFFTTGFDDKSHPSKPVIKKPPVILSHAMWRTSEGSSNIVYLFFLQNFKREKWNWIRNLLWQNKRFILFRSIESVFYIIASKSIAIRDRVRANSILFVFCFSMNDSMYLEPVNGNKKFFVMSIGSINESVWHASRTRHHRSDINYRLYYL